MNLRRLISLRLKPLCKPPGWSRDERSSAAQSNISNRGANALGTKEAGSGF